MPKPVLSDSLFNADDVATAILQQANLQIANSSLGVTDIRSDITLSSDQNENETDFQAFSFNGFVFIAGNLYHAGAMSNSDLIGTINNSAYYPQKAMAFPTIGFEGDFAHQVRIETDGDIRIAHPSNLGTNPHYFIVFNGWYRT